MKSVRIILTSVFLVTTCNGLCEDIDTAACQVMATKNLNLCHDPALSLTACPRFCKKCPVVCYHCDSIVRNYSDCSATRTCKSGEQCMLHQLVSSRDGHQEYKMNCASLDMCDGHGVMMFGRRDIVARNVITQCCSDDLCNSPTYKQAVPTTSSTTSTGCNRDIEILIQDSLTVDRLTVIQFLRDLVSHIQIGPMHNQIGVATYDRDVKNAFDLDTYLHQDDLLHAIGGIHFRHDENEIDREDALEFIQNHLSIRAGERPRYKNVIIIIDDHAFGRRRYLRYLLNQRSQLSNLSKDVIVINVGRAVGHSVFSSLATGTDHQIDITNYSMLSSILPRVLSLLCA